MYKQFTLVVSFCIGITAAFGQSNFYAFQKDTMPYQELTGDSVVTNANFGTGDLFAFGLKGETFTFFDKNYIIDDSTKLIMFSNSGHVQVDDDSSFIIVDGIFTYLDSIDHNTRLSYKIDNTSQDKILKVQWKNLAIRSGQAGNYINCQVWIYQSNGSFEIHYGPSSASNSSGFTAATGPNVGMFYALKDFSKMYEKIWINGTPGTYTIDSTKSIVFKAMHGVPAQGTVYRFVTKKTLDIATTHLQEKTIHIYPNPANTQLNINTGWRGEKIISLMDMDGRVINNVSTSQNLLAIDIRLLPAGSYYINVKNGVSEYTEQVIIRH